MPKKVWGILLLSASLIAFVYAAYRDFSVGTIFPCDMRNRIVGARLIHDGISPYFYKWKQGDPIRYYDPQNFDSLKVSNITASPFFHHLIQPLAELPQWKLQSWWCVLQYLLMLGMVAMAFSLVRNSPSKWRVLAFAAAFLFTDAWKLSIQNGQNYLFIPFLATCIYYILVRKKKSPWWAAAAGTLAITLILIRPNALVFFLPFLLLVKDFGRQRLAAFLIPMLLVAGWTVADKQERSLWQDYRKALGEQVKVHYGLGPTMQINDPDPAFAEWEGIRLERLAYYFTRQPMQIHAENGNFFFLEYVIFHWTIPIPLLLASCLTLIALLTWTYYRKYRKKGPFDVGLTVLFAYCMYMIADLFSPIFRNQYYTVQLLFLLLLSTGFPRLSGKWVRGLLWTGIALNITHFPFIKIQHTLGEYLIVGVIILFSLADEPKITE